VKQKSDFLLWTYVSPSSKEISKIFCISTRIENKVDRLTENSEQDGEIVDRFGGNIVTIHDKVNLETSLSEQSSMTGTSDHTQVRMIHDSIVQLRNQSSSATSFAVNWSSRCSNRMNWSEEMLAAFAERNR
jgi:hypothetical protein